MAGAYVVVEQLLAGLVTLLTLLGNSVVVLALLSSPALLANRTSRY